MDERYEVLEIDKQKEEVGSVCSGTVQVVKGLIRLTEKVTVLLEKSRGGSQRVVEHDTEERPLVIVDLNLLEDQVIET